MPYNSQYFGHKLHIDLNEKLVHFNCVLIGAIDGFSGKILACQAVPKKNNFAIASMYLFLINKYGIWDKIRVDHGREFVLMLYSQFLLQNQRFNQNRRPYVQSTSKMVCKIQNP